MCLWGWVMAHTEVSKATLQVSLGYGILKCVHVESLMKLLQEAYPLFHLAHQKWYTDSPMQRHRETYTQTHAYTHSSFRSGNYWVVPEISKKDTYSHDRIILFIPLQYQQQTSFSMHPNI